VFQVGLCEEQKHLEIDYEGDALCRHSYHHTRNHKQSKKGNTIYEMEKHAHQMRRDDKL